MRLKVQSLGRGCVDVGTEINVMPSAPILNLEYPLRRTYDLGFPRIIRSPFFEGRLLDGHPPTVGLGVSVSKISEASMAEASNDCIVTLQPESP